MTGSGSLISKLLGFIPQGGLGLIGFIVLIALTFSLGYWLSADNGTPSLQEAISEGHDHAADESTTWTCSMHPQIQLPTAGKCPICFMDLIPLESGGDESIDPNQLRLTALAAKLARIQTQPVRRAVAEAEVRLFGRLTYDETRLSYITAWSPGRLDKLHIDFTGATVKKGEPLVLMYSPELLAVQEELI
ncbi:MAG: efflux RND transporter periplasmic adaptor subunit, partial [candidate division Zixibacteria bacterium]|nr:efflux RND transporter periplasmic adaptor subunit [candidate division Zixibacteria bacterium]